MNIKDEIKTGIEEILFANILVSGAPTKDGENLQARMRDLMQAYLKLEKDTSDLAMAKQQVLQKTIQASSANPKDVSFNKILQVLNENLAEKLEQRPERFYESNPQYQELVSAAESVVQQNGDDSDVELAVTQQATQTVDPYTKMPLKDPVKNKVCGHSYEKATVLDLIQNNGRHRCPYMGCSNRRPIKESDLVPDVQLKRILDRQRILGQ